MARFHPKISMTLNMNEYEVRELFQRIGMDHAAQGPEATTRQLTVGQQKIDLDEMVLHSPIFASVSAETEGDANAIQEVHKNMILTAGAGEAFDRGYLAAFLCELSVKEQLVIAHASTAFFLTHASPPTMAELIELFRQEKER